ncbi:hypothetical protein SEVIR_2G432400v4 [Setaria viridis]|uniref:MATH domain-containing protein n=2 Tax=Setaria TaxID=4554 RepID=A0A368QAS3_SETIT|nr:uncharacterized protein LOC117846432 isoform X1 [Setaria viridis]RCV14370.1 hypothetical protein SETIT_2G420100v2 [Setaria italica]TKW36312.1 hypothetical protein SEVIR_2G432400v2 [Setaria viridis]
MAAGDSPSTGASTSDRTDHDSKRTNCNTEERPNALSLKDNGTDRTGLEPFCEAMQNVPLFDFIWTIEGFSLLPKLERHFSETFDSNGLKWGLFLKPWCTIMNDTRYPSLTLYLEDWPGDLEKSGDLAVWCRITIFNQGGCGEDQQFTHTVDGVFARRRDGRWSSIDLLSYDRFLDPSYGFLVDDTCAIGVEIIRVAPTRRLHLDSTCYLYITGSFGISIVGIDPRPDRSLQSSSTSRFRCTIRGLSTEQQLKPCICKKFSSGGYDWIVCVLVGSSHLHVYVHPSLSHICCQLFGRINIRLINQLNGKHIDKSYRGMFNRNIYHGCAGVVALQTLFDKEEGFLVQDCCIVEVEVTVLSRF